MPLVTLPDEDLIDMLRTLAHAVIVRDGMDVKCSVCRGRGPLEEKNIVHTDNCWKDRARRLLAEIHR